MNFNPNYHTVDNIFDIDIDMNNLIYKTGSINPYHESDNITDNVIQVYNNNTDKISYKSLYMNKENKLYFTGNKGKGKGSQRYYIKNLIKNNLI